ncbi:helix-turn-helix domain-containing protein [Tsukamurella ocularis]
MQSLNGRVGAITKQMRVDRGWSQGELAEKLARWHNKKVDPTTVTRLEGGTRPTTVADVEALAGIFGTSAAAILGLDEGAPGGDEGRAARLLLRAAEDEIDAAANQLRAAHTEVGEANRRMARAISRYEAAQAALNQALVEADTAGIPRGLLPNPLATAPYQAVLEDGE